MLVVVVTAVVVLRWLLLRKLGRYGGCCGRCWVEQ